MSEAAAMVAGVAVEPGARGDAERSAVTSALKAVDVPAAVPVEVSEPSFLRTYSLTYALGAVWLAVELVLLGSQGKYEFNTIYSAAMIMPPALTALSLLLVDRSGPARSFPLRFVVLWLTAGIASILSTVLLTPLLILMFRGGVGDSLSATGMLSAISLVVVGAPLVIELIAAGRAHRWMHAVLMILGIGLVGTGIAMALAPTGALASSMRLDQGEILMITSSWWLPMFALAAAFARKLGMA